jgi:hypothetical protein
VGAPFVGEFLDEVQAAAAGIGGVGLPRLGEPSVIVMNAHLQVGVVLRDEGEGQQRAVGVLEGVGDQLGDHEFDAVDQVLVGVEAQ